MSRRLQYTRLNRNFGKVLVRLENWSKNPWRRYSLFTIVLLSAFLIGSSIGMINGVLALMDPIGAFFAVLLLELMVRSRRRFIHYRDSLIIRDLMDMTRIGLLYGLLMEGFKLL